MDTVDVRDVTAAFAAAITADVVGETLLIAGDERQPLTQYDTAEGPAAARGLRGLARAMMGRPGNPEATWFINGWMDVAHAQQVLSFQHHSWPEMLAEMRAIASWKRYPTQLFAPVSRRLVKRQSAYRNWPGKYADLWAALRMRYGEPTMDTNRS